MAKAFTTKHLQRALLKSLNEDSVAARNSVARIGAVMIATKQLELNERAQGKTDAVTLVDEDPAVAQIAAA